MTVDLTERAPAPLTDGPLWEALVAATALAGMFPPYERGGHRLVDGLALVPVPTVAVQEAGADITVSVNLMARETLPAWPGEEPPSEEEPARKRYRMLDTLLEVMDLAQLDTSVRNAAAGGRRGHAALRAGGVARLRARRSLPGGRARRRATRTRSAARACTRRHGLTFTFADLKRLLVERIGMSEEEVGDDPALAFDEMDLDSLAFEEIQLALENAYGFSISFEDAQTIRTLGDAIEYTNRRIAEQATH